MTRLLDARAPIDRNGVVWETVALVAKPFEQRGVHVHLSAR